MERLLLADRAGISPPWRQHGMERDRGWLVGQSIVRKTHRKIRRSISVESGEDGARRVNWGVHLSEMS
jgi:hypothetical protein